MAEDEFSLKLNDRGPTLLVDFHLREKITHFDQERIPERIVHARGSGAYGTFELTVDMSEYTFADFLMEREKRLLSLSVCQQWLASVGRQIPQEMSAAGQQNSIHSKEIMTRWAITSPYSQSRMP